jgi:ubiquinone/menaquinone biosynthesis C-methylase UbiE
MLLTMGMAPALRRQTAELAEIGQGESVLEVGCGTGEVTLAAKAKTGAAGQVVGLDPSPEMIAVAHDKAQQKGVAIDFEVGVIEAIPFPDDSFDVVLSSLMMHHLPDALKARGLAEIRRVLKPGGRLLIVDFKRPTSHFGHVVMTALLHGHLQTGVQDLPAKLAAAGFGHIRVGNTNIGAIGYIRAQASP